MDLRISKPVQDRVAALAQLANEGLLSRDEYEALVNAEDLISTLRHKAQLSLSLIP